MQGIPQLERHTILILATPNFASWLEASSDFIPKALQCVFGASSLVEADVVCGVCDGVAPHPLSMKSPSGAGFSVLHKPWKIDNLWDNIDTRTGSNNLQSTLSFLVRARFDATLTLPLANTLFNNGRLSTLLLSRWKSSGDSFEISRDQIEKQNIAMKLFTRAFSIPRDLIPCVPLTPLRRIHSGLGNIVRTIDFSQDGKSDIGPASRELERSVTEYLAKGGHDQPTIGVWALVIPQEVLSILRYETRLEEELTTTDIDALRAEISHSTPKGRRYMGRCIEEGARLVRVLSGGGGWGLKEGLLSLDPQTTYRDSNESRYDYSEGFLDEQQASALGNVAQEGDFIQFLVAAKNDEGPVNSLPRNEPEEVDFTQSSTVVGVVPSTVDDVHDEIKNVSTTSNIQIYPGHFGIVSESGIFLGGVKEKKTDNGKVIRSIETKIDLPFSYFYEEHGKRGSRVSRVDEGAERLGDEIDSDARIV